MNKGIIVCAIGLAGIAVLHVASVSALREEMQALRAEVKYLASAPTAVPPRDRARLDSPVPISLGALPERVSQLEQSVAALTQTADFLAERGMAPRTPEIEQRLQARFYDPSASDRDRLRSLQLIRRNQGIDDTVASQAVSWLQSSTNESTRRNILRSLDGSTNALLKQPVLAMLAGEKNERVREELVDVLGEFASDPNVDEKLWDLALNDSSARVRREAENAIEHGPATPERLEVLRERADDSQLSLDARLLALRGLSEADASAPGAVAELASLAQSSTDPLVRAKLFGAFDDIRDPSLMAPLVYGLQDPNPVVRERAADALSSYASDERIQQWLSHVSQTDTDPRVQREAFRALEQSRRSRGN